MVIRALVSLLGAAALAACQHAQPTKPAVLQAADTDSLDALRAALGQAMDQAEIELGAGDPTETPSVAVLPPKPSRFETQSPAMPTLFDLYIRGETCFAVRRGEAVEIALPGVSCRPAN